MREPLNQSRRALPEKYTDTKKDIVPSGAFVTASADNRAVSGARVIGKRDLSQLQTP